MEDKKMATAETATTETDAKVVNSSETTNDSPEKTMDWTNRLQTTPKGKILMTPGNLIMIAENDPCKQSAMTFSTRDTWRQKTVPSAPGKLSISTMPHSLTSHGT